MKTKQQRTQIAESAIFLLKDGIANNSKSKIKVAYELIEEDEQFDWDDLDVLYMEWEELVELANDIIYA